MELDEIVNETQVLEELKNNTIIKINELNKQKKELLKKAEYYIDEIEKLNDLYKREKEIKEAIKEIKNKRK